MKGGWHFGLFLFKSRPRPGTVCSSCCCPVDVQCCDMRSGSGAGALVAATWTLCTLLGDTCSCDITLDIICVT